MSTVASHINPTLLTWAREQQGLSLGWAIEKSGFAKLTQWEAGHEFPTMPQLRKLAHFYRRPSALFFLPGPPASAPALNDFRSHSGSHAEPLSPEARTEIRVCESRRLRALELGLLLSDDMSLRIGAAAMGDDVEESTTSLRQRLGIDVAALARLKEDRDVLAYWISRIEAQNILVFRSITLSSFNSSYKEIRGTSAYYADLPWILLNSQEHHRAQLFTLGHELAHVLLRENSLCNLGEPEAAAGQDVERYCNSISAALLMPREAVDSILEQIGHHEGEDGLDIAVDRLAKTFHVSREAASRRLVSLGHAAWAYYSAVRAKQIVARDLERQHIKDEDGGGNGKYYYKRVLDWNGRKFCTLVIEAYHRERISMGEAAEALRTRTSHLGSIERELYS